jgi:endo-1,4-beta-mannosidase
MLKLFKNKILVKTNFLFVLGLFISISYFLLVSYKTVLAQEQQTWIKIEENGFAKDGKLFKFIGASAVNLVFYDDWDLDIEKAIQTAKENNISVLRFYIDLGWGKNEDFDRIFDIASKYGVYIILAFTDCCCSGDYANLKKYFEVHAPFCNITNKQSILAFKKLIKQIIERRNSINGRIYRDDPTILAWEIANELEYWHFAESDVYRWISDISTYVKGLDKNHLVTIGISTNNFDLSEDSSLYKIFNVATLDFLSFHYYPDSNNLDLNKDILQRKEDIYKIEFITKKFLSLHKPVIISEFGFSNSMDLNLKIRSNENTVDSYNLAFKKYMDTAFSAGASGVMFWGWGIPEEKEVPMWWSQESHTSADKKFCIFLKEYQIPNK